MIGSENFSAGSASGDSPGLSYALAVDSGDIVAGKWVRLAARRHLEDLENGHSRGLYFDVDAARHAIDFFPLFLRHYKGEWAGQPFELFPWEEFVVASIFGWMREDGFRRFRRAFVSVGRKNGKTALAAGIGLYLFCADGEPAAEVYAAATKRDQARISHKDAIRFVRASPDLRRLIRIYRDNLSIDETASKFEPLGQDSYTEDGLSPHGALIDELHAHKTPEMLRVLRSGTGARRQSLIFIITTAGYRSASVCRLEQNHAEKVLEGIFADDRLFAYIAALDQRKRPESQVADIEEKEAQEPDDDWEDETKWIKGNPSLPYLRTLLDDIRDQARVAKQQPTELNDFLRRRCNVWTQQETRWIQMPDWYANSAPVPLGELQGRFCTSGLDLASTVDLAAFCICWPPTIEDPDGPYYFLWRFWIPGENIEQRVHLDQVPYDAWVREALIKATVGNCIDHATIRKDILADAERFKLKEFAFDRFGASEIVTYLENEGLTATPFGQGTVSMNPPMRQLEGLLKARRAIHGGNKVVTWMASNVVATQDSAGNLRPDREKSIEKIDGISAQLMSLGRAIRHKTKRSPYLKRGIRTI